MKRYVFAAFYLWCGLILNEGSGPHSSGLATQAAAVVVLPAFAAVRLVTEGKISD